MDYLRWLAWAHDLNRWPFAHNSEVGVFDQSGDVVRYFGAQRIPASDECLRDVAGVISRDYTGLTAEARMVLLADMVAGFIEDPLLAITGLDLAPEMIPPQVAEALTLPLEDASLLRQLLRLNVTLSQHHDLSTYEEDFDALFRQRVMCFFRRYNSLDEDALGSPWFERLRRLIKDEFLREHIFPYNNEKVAHGSILRRELVEPVLRILGDQATATFTAINEDQFIDRAILCGVIDSGSVGRYYPSLDYIEEEEPEASFRYRHRANW